MIIEPAMRAALEEAETARIATIPYGAVAPRVMEVRSPAQYPRWIAEEPLVHFAQSRPRPRGLTHVSHGTCPNLQTPAIFRYTGIFGVT